MSVDVRAKLAEKGLTLPVASKPLAAYVPAVRTGKIVFTAGQLPMVDGAIAAAGKVGSDITQEEANKLAEICALNALAAVELVAPVDSIDLSITQQWQMAHLSCLSTFGAKQEWQPAALLALQNCH
jgi:enamine deaminase RidA (YjgF/YER057c/UK114 family)